MYRAVSTMQSLLRYGRRAGDRTSIKGVAKCFSRKQPAQPFILQKKQRKRTVKGPKRPAKTQPKEDIVCHILNRISNMGRSCTFPCDPPVELMLGQNQKRTLPCVGFRSLPAETRDANGTPTQVPPKRYLIFSELSEE